MNEPSAPSPAARAADLETIPLEQARRAELVNQPLRTDVPIVGRR
jgi:hypothetical protein